jgi:hypothetical protein
MEKVGRQPYLDVTFVGLQGRSKFFSLSRDTGYYNLLAALN